MFLTKPDFPQQSKENEMIKVVLLDIDDTLLDFHKGAEQAIKNTCLQYGVPYSEQMLSIFFETNTRLWSQIEKETLTKPELYEIRWPSIFSRLGIDCNGRAFEESYRQTLKSIAIPVDGAIDMLCELSKSFRVFAASNASYDMQIARLTNARMLQYFEAVFVSENLGHVKPSREFFECCMKNIGDYRKDEVVMVGDSLSADISGGKAFGIKTCHFDRGYLKEKSVVPDVTVTKLSDVKKALENM